MKQLYTRLIHWLIAPAVREIVLQESRQGGSVWRMQNDAQIKLSAEARKLSEILRNTIQDAV